MADEKLVWVARGPCPGCGKPKAKRTSGPGEVDVPCGACGALTRMPAAQLRLGPGGPTPVAPDAPPALPPRAPSPAPVAGRLGRMPWAIPLALVAVVTLGAVAWWLLGGGGLALLQGGEPDAPIEWVIMNQTLVPDFQDDRVLFRVETEAYDAEGNRIPPERLADVGDWAFANGTTRVASAEDISDWTPCNPLNCTYAVPAGAILYFNNFGPYARGAAAFDTGTRNLSIYGFSEWRHVEDWEAHFRSFRTARVVGKAPGEDGTWRLHVFSNASNENEVTLNVSILQGGVLVESGLIDAMSPFGAPWKMPEFSTDVQEGEVEVRVSDLEGTLLASRILTPSDCTKLETQVYVAIADDGTVHLDETLCI